MGVHEVTSYVLYFVYYLYCMLFHRYSSVTPYSENLVMITRGCFNCHPYHLLRYSVPFSIDISGLFMLVIRYSERIHWCCCQSLPRFVTSYGMLHKTEMEFYVFKLAQWYLGVVNAITYLYQGTCICEQLLQYQKYWWHVQPLYHPRHISNLLLVKCLHKAYKVEVYFCGRTANII